MKVAKTQTVLVAAVLRGELVAQNKAHGYVGFGR